MTDADFAELFSGAPFGYLTTTVDGTVTLVNDTLLTWLGRQRDDIVGATFGELLDPGSRLFWETRHQQVLLLRGAATEVALTLLSATGEPFPALSSSIVVRDEAGTTVGMRIALLSTAERLEYERALLEATRAAQRSGARLQVLQASAATLITAVSEAAVIESLVASTSEAFDASSVTVFLFDASGQLRSAGGTERIPSPEGGAWRAITERRPVTVSDMDEAAAQFPAFLDIMRADRIEAFSAVPMVADGPAFGALLCTFARPRRIHDEMVDLQVALALQATQALVRLRLQARLEQQALHDPLTGLANRQLLHERLERALAESDSSLAVMFFDVDGFKLINDRDGHATGDAALIEVARRLAASVRSGDVCARYGGDEFVVICEGADEDAALAVAERVRASMTRPFTMSSTLVTASIGVAVVPAGAPTNADAVLELADAAMYRSKDDGRDRITMVTI